MDRHNEFQFGTNPIKMTAFEEMLKFKEELERRRAKIEYTAGIQGVDGGRCYDRKD